MASKIIVLRVELDDILVDHIIKIGKIRTGIDIVNGSCGLYDSKDELFSDMLGSVYTGMIFEAVWNGISKELDDRTLIMKIKEDID